MGGNYFPRARYCSEGREGPIQKAYGEIPPAAVESHGELTLPCKFPDL